MFSNNNPNETKKLEYDYYDTTIYSNQYNKTLVNGGYVQLPFVNSKSVLNPNLTYANKKYKISEIYVLKKTHVIEDANYDGELIIVHTPTTNGAQPIYSCILLKTIYGIQEENDIDRLIKQSYQSSLVINLNNVLSHNTSFLTNPDNSVFIFKSPVLVTTRFDNFSDTPNKLFNYTNDFREHKMVESFGNIQEGFQEGARGRNRRRNKNRKRDPMTFDIKSPFTGKTGSQKIDIKNAYLECNPTGSSKSTIEMYQIPVAGGLSKDLGKVGILTTTLHFFVFLIISVLIVLVSPVVYKIGMVDLVSKSIIDSNKKPGSLKTFDTFMLAILILFSVLVCISGIRTKNQVLTSLGVFSFIIIMISTCVIFYYKTLDPIKYGLIGPDIGETGHNSEFISLFFRTMKENMGSFMKLFIIFLTIYLIVVLVLHSKKRFSKDKKKNNKIRNSLLIIGILYGFIFCCYLTYIHSMS
jgi:hypothetical protein